MNRLKDKVAIITGATSVGIGRETALRLSSEGAFLTITGRNEEEGQKTTDMVINAVSYTHLTLPTIYSV